MLLCEINTVLLVTRFVPYAGCRSHTFFFLLWFYSAEHSDNSYPSHPDQGQCLFSLLQTVTFHSSVCMFMAVVVVLLNDTFWKKLFTQLKCYTIKAQLNVFN